MSENFFMLNCVNCGALTSKDVESNEEPKCADCKFAEKQVSEASILRANLASLQSRLVKMERCTEAARALFNVLEGYPRTTLKLGKHELMAFQAGWDEVGDYPEYNALAEALAALDAGDGTKL